MPQSITTTFQNATEGASTKLTSLFTATLILTALSDWLFWGTHFGLSIALWMVAVVVSASIVNRTKLDLIKCAGACVMLLLAMAPIVETINPLSLAFAGIGLATSILLLSNQDFGAWPLMFLAPLRVLAMLPFRIFIDLDNATAKGEKIVPRVNIVTWIVPIGFTALFLILFASANPVIDRWLPEIDFRRLFSWLSPTRFLFWLAAFVLIWGFIQARTNTEKKNRAAKYTSSHEAAHLAADDPIALLFSPAATLRSLILFNVLFAVQTGLDVTYLWHGATLPKGLTYASYAHRGAYPLMIVTALSALFVIASFGPRRDSENSRLSRWLVFAWIVQNVFLVCSAMQRLNLYVDVYALSYWRIAAFIWMGLIAAGLVLIFIRIAFQRSNAWLVGANLATTLGVLYVCCFMNFPAFIANYNVDHSREVTGVGNALDIPYIKSLGRHAVPAMIKYHKTKKTIPLTGWPGSIPQTCLVIHRLEHVTHDWRAWTYRDHRLLQKLRAQADQC